MANAGNFCVLNQNNNLMDGTSGTNKVEIKNGGLSTEDKGSYYSGYTGSIAVSGTGKFYYEYKVINAANNSNRVGWIDTDQEQNSANASSNAYPGGTTYTWCTNTNAPNSRTNFANNNQTSSSYIGAAVADNDIYCVGLDLSDGTMYVSKNEALNPATASSTATTSTGSFKPFNNLDGGRYAPMGGEQGGGDGYFNFGQDSTFGGSGTAGSGTDANGYGDFKYAPPSDYLALCTSNMPIDDDIDPNLTDDDIGSKNFNVVLFDGTGTSNAVTGLGFQPDLIWGYTRSGSQSKRIVDSSRGGSERLHTDTANAATTGTVVISEFGTDGFTANGGQFNNDSGKTCAAWCWRANGGTTATNTSGTIDSVTQANTKAGFSIITYTGTGTNGTIGHGLSAAPDFYMVKDRARGGESWNVYHTSTGATKYLVLDTDAAVATNSNRWNDTAPTTSLISLGTNDNTNGSSTYICYAWHSVEGYSSFGKYFGNGNASGPFVYTGFRPRLIFVKLEASAGDWWTQDTARTTVNPLNEYHAWNRSDQAATGLDIDCLANGFKIRTTSGDLNSNHATILYGAWGDVPFKYGNPL